MDTTLALLDTYGVGLLFVVILLKEIGVPVPVPGDLLMVVAGARAAAGKLPLWGVLLGAIVACGLAPVPMSTFLAGLVAGTLLFVGFHTLLGFVAGPGVGSIFDNLNVPIWPFLLALALIGIVGWLWIRARRRG